MGTPPHSYTVWKLFKLLFNFQTFLHRGHFNFLFSRLYSLSSNKVGFEALNAPASEVSFYMCRLWCLIITKQIIIQLNCVDVFLNCLCYFHWSSFEFNYHTSIFSYNICFWWLTVTEGIFYHLIAKCSGCSLVLFKNS